MTYHDLAPRTSALAAAAPVTLCGGLACALAAACLSAFCTSAGGHEIAPAVPPATAEDGLILGNGDLSASVYYAEHAIRWRLGKGDVWDRRIDRSDDPAPPTIAEVANGIAHEGWRCGPYGGGEVVATRGSQDPARMTAICCGTPPSYKRRPYPCPKPAGELALHLPADVFFQAIRMRLSVETSVLEVDCRASDGAAIEIESFIPPDDNVLVVRWRVSNWSRFAAVGSRPPFEFDLYRWADPSIAQFAKDFWAKSGNAAFMGNDFAKCLPLPPPAFYRAAGIPAISQGFPPDPTYPSGFSCCLAAVSQTGAFAPQSLPDRAAHLRWAPGPSDAWIAINVASGDTQACLRQLTEFKKEATSRKVSWWRKRTLEAATEFWSKSAVSISDPVLENLWYDTYYIRRSVMKAGKVPPGLFLPSTVNDYSAWHGDYHTNYNFQEGYWGDYAANHIELGDAYFTGMAHLLQMGRIIAHRYYACRGAFVQLSGYPIQATDDVLGAVPMGRMAYMTGWAAEQYWTRYAMTGDRDWLRRVGYPALRDCALFYADFMKKGPDGLYHIFPSNQGEDGFSGKASDVTDRAQVMRYARICLRMAIAANGDLHLDDGLRRLWQERLANLAGDEGRPPVGPERTLSDRIADWNEPEFGGGRPVRELNDEGRPWPPPDSSIYRSYAAQYTIGAIARMRTNGLDGGNAYRGLRQIITQWQHPNGLVWAMSASDYGSLGAWTEGLGTAAVIQEMMLESNGGLIRIFPHWPVGLAGRFVNFRAEGAFLISATVKAGTISGLAITSEEGKQCHILDPWNGPVVIKDRAGRHIEAINLNAGAFEFPTKIGETYLISPLINHLSKGS